MMKIQFRNSCFIIFCSCFFYISATAQTTDSLSIDTTSTIKKEKRKTGWGFGALPAVSYNTDVGLQYGGLVNLYYYGDGSKYPEYLHSIYLEWSTTTKGSGTKRFFYDSKHLIPGIRLTTDLSYLTEQALDFYGFNGYQSTYNTSFENDASSKYISRMYYKHERKMLRIKTDFQGRFKGSYFGWLAGYTHINININTVDIDKLNKGKNESDKLPDTLLLYDKYVDWGIITPKEANGGINNFVHAGLVYDSRNNEPNPMKGIWTELIVSTAPKALDNNEYHFTKLAVIHRQYFTLISEKLSFAYRLSYQGTISGKAPFYLQTNLLTSYMRGSTSEGLGGSRSLRGILRNRIVGDDIAFGNAEFRWKFWQGNIRKSNVYLALNPFIDAGKVIKEIPVDETLLPATEDPSNYFDRKSDALHICYGMGLHIAINQNFIIACEYGLANDKRDGRIGLYIALNFLF